jgi:HSP20 family protein
MQPTTKQVRRSDVERLFDRFAASFGFPVFRRLLDMEPSRPDEDTFGTAMPAADISEDDHEFKITAELPGMSEKDIEVSINGDRLLIKGEKRQEREDKSEHRYLSERSFGTFQRSFMLPDGIDRSKISAAFSKGVLTLTLPKTPEAQKQQKIEVKAA